MFFMFSLLLPTINDGEHDPQGTGGVRGGSKCED